MSSPNTTTLTPSITATNVPLITPGPVTATGPFAVVQTILNNAQLYSAGAGTPSDVQSGIANLYTNLAKLNNESSTVLNGQDTLNNIINEEKKTLGNRIDAISKDTDSAKRIMQLNEYSRLKTADYNMILYYFIALMIGISVLFIIKKIIPGIPSFVFELTLILIVCLCIYMVYYKYLDISRRDLIYYDQVAVPEPTNINLSPKQINAANALNGFGIGFNGIGVCANETCCDTVNNTTVWDAVQQQCVSNDEEKILLAQRASPTAAPMDTSSSTPSVSAFTLMNSAQPNSYYEYTNYSAV